MTLAARLELWKGVEVIMDCPPETGFVCIELQEASAQFPNRAIVLEVGADYVKFKCFGGQYPVSGWRVAAVAIENVYYRYNPGFACEHSRQPSDPRPARSGAS